MDSKFAAAILLAILPLAVGAQTPGQSQSSGRVVVAGTESGQRSMQRQQDLEARRSKQELDRQARLELMELQRALDRERRQIAEQRKQLQRLSAKTEPQRGAAREQQARVAPEARSQSATTVR